MPVILVPCKKCNEKHPHAKTFLKVDPAYTLGCLGVYDEYGELIDCICQDPKPHSHRVSYNCIIQLGLCRGTCSYDCDEGYTWNPVTQQCEAPAVFKAFWDGLAVITQ